MTPSPSNASGYAPGSASTGIVASGEAPKKAEYWTLEQCKQAYLDYAGSKSAELDEIREARRYRHHSQWTAAQIEVLNKRKQPVVTYPRIGRKIDGIVGTVERLKQDPKAYPRTPKQEQGADLATAALRYALEAQQWEAKTPIAADNCATDGHSGLEFEIIEGDQGDSEVGINLVEDGFFYDPRSFRLDFSDARYMGVSKLVDVETAIEMMPDAEEDIRASAGHGTELSVNSDRDNRWFTTIGKRKFIRLVDLWYKHKGGWCWAIFTGSAILMEGRSFLKDEKKKEACKYEMFRCAVDQDGDSYGFVRGMKSSQDEINQRRSKGLHILNTRRIIAETGAFDDIEEARREAAKPDGMVIRNKGFEAEFDDEATQLDLSGQLKFLEDAKSEIDNFGPSQVVTGDGVDGQSGRAIQLRQNAALAELGPFILSYRAWKLRVYRKMFAAIQEHWTGERWIRVTDDDGLAQFIGINQTKDENGQPVVDQNGNPAIMNALGSVDVDIILDEGPDTINAAADANETLKELIPAVAGVMPPPKMIALVDAYIETSFLPAEMKSKYRQVSQQLEQQPPQPNPEVVKAQQEAQIAQQKMQTEAQLKQQQVQTDAQLETAKTENEINLARVKAASEIQIAREKAAADIEIKQHAQHMQFKLDANLQRKEMGEEVDDNADVVVSSPVMEALKHIADGIAQTHKVASAPRRTTLVRDAAGRAKEAVSTVEA
jgi:hypothetical protein